MTILKSAALAAALALAAGAASAQDFNLEPRYGVLNLEAGFWWDPVAIPVMSGGNIDAATVSSSCSGWISNEPDFRVNFTHGSGLPLTFKVQSEGDTTLVINAADGTWHCNDDTDGVNPAVTFSNPPSGQYDIWVGTFGEPTIEPAALMITELD